MCIFFAWCFASLEFWMSNPPSAEVLPRAVGAVGRWWQQRSRLQRLRRWLGRAEDRKRKIKASLPVHKTRCKMVCINSNACIRSQRKKCDHCERPIALTAFVVASKEVRRARWALAWQCAKRNRRQLGDSSAVRHRSLLWREIESVLFASRNFKQMRSQM